jgi:hypothetical protein
MAIDFTANEPFRISNEYNITELLAHFDSNYIFDVLEDKLSKLSYSVTLSEPNIVGSFETYFKYAIEQYPGDGDNIRAIREDVYTHIINILTDRFNLRFNNLDEGIDKFTAAYYLYDFTVCNRNNYITAFYTAFIINNKNGIASTLNMDEYRKNKDSAAAYNKRVYEDQTFALISANMSRVIDYIATFDIRLGDIFQSIYTDHNIAEFLDNAYADGGNFFYNHYYLPIKKPEFLPVAITNIKLALQRLVGTKIASQIEEIMNAGMPTT